MAIADRYASAVHAGSLKPAGIKGRDEDRPQNPDVLGAFGLAAKTLADGHDRRGKTVPPAPLAVPLARLLSGDSRAVYEIVRLLTELAFRQSYEMDVRVSLGECKRMAQATLAWFRHGTCTECGGHGYELIPGAPMLSERECKACAGRDRGKVPFAPQFDKRHRALAEWMREQVELSVGRAGPQALRHLSSRAALEVSESGRM